MSANSLLLTNAKLATMNGTNAPYGLIDDGVIAMQDGIIAFAGKTADLPRQFNRYETMSLDGRLVTPGLIDCHTHIVHGGNRAAEFEMWLKGAIYEEVARAGGGIVSTVSATRAASEKDLLTSALPRVDALLAEGVTTLEIKSGFKVLRKEGLYEPNSYFTGPETYEVYRLL